MSLFPKTSPITDRRIKVALAGCGRISEKHFEAIKQHQASLELVGVCDPNLNRLEDISAKARVPGYRTLESLLGKSDADLIVLATPSGLHCEQSIQIAKSGRHIMTEKPMATR